VTTKAVTPAAAGAKDTQKKLAACADSLRQLGRVVVAFSAGVDSTFLLSLAAETLGPANVLAAVGVSPSLPQRELASARELAGKFGAELIEVPTGEMENPQYAANPARRCYFCKHDLFTRLLALAKTRGYRAVISGANADDTGDFRPGLSAGAELGVRNPLLEAGLTKAEIRALSRQRGLPTWDKPAMACLASRVPYDSPITPARLGRIEQMASREQIVRQLKAAGYVYVAADLAGLRSGSGNEMLGLPPAQTGLPPARPATDDPSRNSA
jgi:uncharacterized protein